MKGIIDMLGAVKYSQANTAIQIAKGKYELPSVTFRRMLRRMFKKLIYRNHG